MIFKTSEKITISVFISDENYFNLELTLKYLENLNSEIILFDTTSEKRLEKLSNIPLEYRVFYYPKFTFHDFIDFSIKNSNRDFLLLLKSGEIIYDSFFIEIFNLIQSEKGDKFDIVISYLDLIFPFSSFIETRLIKSGNPDISDSETKYLYNEVIFSTNSLKKDIFINNKIPGENINRLFNFSASKASNILSLIYIGIALNINREYINSIKILDTFISLYLENNELKMYALVFQGSNYYYLKDYEKSYDFFQKALNFRFPSYFPGIWLFNFFIRKGEIKRAFCFLDHQVKAETRINFHQEYLLTLQKNFIDFQREKILTSYGNQTDFNTQGKFNSDKSIKVIKKRPVITAMLAIKNEKKYISRVLEDLSEYVNSIAILDDASTDSTSEIVKSYSKVKVFCSNPPGTLRHEGRDRNLLFREAKKLNPDWFLCLDGDEIFENRMKDEILNLTFRNNIEGYFFPIFHFWRGETHFRTDSIWRNQTRFKLFRNRDEYSAFENKKLHVSSIPENFPFEKVQLSNIRLKHYGYSNYSDTVRKYEFYEKEDNEKNISDIGAENYFHLINEDGIKLIEWEENMPQRNNISLCFEINENSNEFSFRYLESVKQFFKQIYLIIPENFNFETYSGFITIKTDNKIQVKNKLLEDVISSDWILFLKPDEYILASSIKEILKDLKMNYDIILNFKIVQGSQLLSNENRLIRTGKGLYFMNNDFNSLVIPEIIPVKPIQISIHKNNQR